MNAPLITREQIQARLKQLPSLPSAVSELLSSFGDEDVDVEQISRQIARDQGLTARVLRVANSSFYGLQSKVGAIHEAVVLLGFKAVRSIVLAVGMSGAFRVDQCAGFDAKAYLRHAVASALAARALAGAARVNPEYAFTAGLLHDIGQLVLASNFPAQYAEVMAWRRTEDCKLDHAERTLIGLDHAEVGGMLAEAWRFPAYLGDAIRLHHQPGAHADSTATLADVVHVANITAHALGLASPDELVPPLDEAAWGRLGLTQESYAALLPRIVAGMDEACAALGA